MNDREFKEYCSNKSVRELKIYIEDTERVLNNIERELKSNQELSENEINDHKDYIKKYTKNLDVYREILQSKES